MRPYIIRRLLLIIPTLVIASTLCFAILRFIPGDAVDLMVNMSSRGMHAGTDEAGLTPHQAIRRALGLDLPIHVQYGRWITGLLKGDLGKSLWSGESVLELVLEKLPVSLEVGLMAIVVSLFIAIPVGIVSGMRPESGLDYILRSISIFFICIPSFWLGTIVVVFPAKWWYWSPRTTWISFFEDPIENLVMFIIPAIILGMWLSGMTMRLVRNMMLEVLRKDYVRTAWSKGLREKIIILRHVLKNSLIPVITMIGLQLPVVIGGAIVVEYLFNLPGLGSFLVEAINYRDYPVITGVNIFLCSFVLLINLVVDISYAWLDPRIRYS